MSNVTIPDLPPGAGPTAASQFESVEGIASVRYTAAQIVGAGSAGTFLTKANNLSDVASVPAARTNLGVTATGADVTYAFRANNLSDLASIPAARTNLGITASGADAAYVWRTNNLSDLTNITTARTNLGLGTAAVKNTGTSGNTVPLLDGVNTFSGATNVFNGNVGIGMTPSLSVDILRDQNTGTQLRINNPNTGASAYAGVNLFNGTTNAVFYQTGINYPVSGMDAPNSSTLYSNAASWRIYTGSPQPVIFGTSNVERMRIDAAGFLKASDVGTYPGLANLAHELTTSTAGVAAMIHNTNANPYGLLIKFTAASPNNASNHMTYWQDSAGARGIMASNGGLQNYSANNVNLSDANVKDQITPYSKAELDALEQSFTNVIWGKFKYRDQTHTDWNHGPTAQGIERAFEKSAPELVDESELGTKPESGVKHKVIYETDLAHIAHALLASVLKSHASALTRISDLEARLAAVGA